MLTLFSSLGPNGGHGFGPANATWICDAECNFNKSVPGLRTNFCAPLAAMARCSRTTAFVAKNILLMLAPNDRAGKLIQVFESNLYPRLQDDDAEVTKRVKNF